MCAAALQWFLLLVEQELRQFVVVLGTELFGREALRERAAVGDHEVVDVPGHDHVGRQLRGVAQDLRNEHAPLPVDHGVLAEVVDALEKLVFRAMDRRQLGEFLLELTPDRKGIEEKVAAVNRGNEEIASEGFFDLLPKKIRHFQPALLVETGRGAPPKAIHSSFGVPSEARDHFLPLLARFGHCADVRSPEVY